MKNKKYIKRFNESDENLDIFDNFSDNKNNEKCWVVRDGNGDIIFVVKSDDNRDEIRKKGWYLDEYKLFDK